MEFEIDARELIKFADKLDRATDGIPDKQEKVRQKAAEEIVSAAKGAAPSRQAAKAAQALQSVRSGGEAGISASLRWFHGAELGAIKYHQFPSWRGTVPANATSGSVGYFLFPTIRRYAKKYRKILGDDFIKSLSPPFK